MGVTLRFDDRRFLATCGKLAELAPAAFADALQRPVFVIGVPRSGTSLLLKLLLKHPQVGGFPQEANHLWHPHLYPWRDKARGARVPPYEIDPKAFTEASLARWTDADAQRIKSAFGAAQYLYGTAVFVNKSAMLCHMIPHVLDVFPGAKLIHVVRDGRAAAYSRAVKEHAKMEQHAGVYRGEGFYREFDELLMHCARAWSGSLAEIDRCARAHGLTAAGAMTCVRYEDLCGEPRRTLVRLCRFMGVDTDADMLGTLEVQNQNSKYRDALSRPLLERMSTAMQTALQGWEYG